MTSVFLFLLSVATASTSSSTHEIKPCESAKEFITTFEFLRGNSELAGSGDNSVKVASEVAKGCTGAAKRFIQIANALRKVELPLNEVLTTASEFSKKEDSTVEAFQQIFKRSYAEDGFDLDLATSLQIAKSLSIQFLGSTKRSLQDFEKIFDFCLSEKDLNLPKPTCAILAQKVALSGQESGIMASEAFLSSFQYFRKEVRLSIQESLKISQDLVQTSPQAFQNFKLSYEYALSEKGLKASKHQALLFGKKISQMTVPEIKSSNAK